MHGFTCYGQAVLQRFDRSAAAVQREFDVGRSEIAAARLKRAQHVDRRHRLGTAASAPPPPRAPVLLLPLRLLPLRLPVGPWKEVRPWMSPGGSGAARAGPKLAPSMLRAWEGREGLGGVGKG